MHFVLVLIELFSLGITAETLRAKMDRKSAILLWIAVKIISLSESGENL